MVTMLSKSIKLSEKDRVGLGDIIKRDHRMLKGPSEALRVIVEDAAENVPDWRKVQERADGLGYPKELMIDGSDIKTFKINAEAFLAVLGTIKQQLHLTKPRTAFVVRMCILNARLRLQKDKRVRNEESIINEKSALLENFKKLSLEEQLFEIYKILLERRDGE